MTQKEERVGNTLVEKRAARERAATRQCLRREVDGSWQPRVFVMEDLSIHRGIWDGDAKAVQQCLTDIFTSVYTTCDIPENAIFGPCVLSHTSLYDSIAFIALKSTDKRTVPYIFRVDTSAANGSSEGLMWLRLVQSARDKEEQNLEAYIKNGQLFYRSLRRIAKDEELLVWYGKELTELLLLCPSRSHGKMNGSSPYTCLECSQRFQFEFPYAAHLRFRCPKRLPGPELSSPDEHGGGLGAKDHGLWPRPCSHRDRLILPRPGRWLKAPSTRLEEGGQGRAHRLLPKDLLCPNQQQDVWELTRREPREGRLRACPWIRFQTAANPASVDGAMLPGCFRSQESASRRASLGRHSVSVCRRPRGPDRHRTLRGSAKVPGLSVPRRLQTRVRQRQPLLSGARCQLRCAARRPAVGEERRPNVSPGSSSPNPPHPPLTFLNRVPGPRSRLTFSLRASNLLRQL
ncbi:PR domain zinc finger protein 8 [Echinops telfairi]|uniref:PR domain zinc finger protein 8 n=1 Tax=Echinops telfairi TaxID=9371 RepID=A0AC55CLP5_ECHTE|nr:PR domain zinc finger protein 8 [Echinops telfairi]